MKTIILTTLLLIAGLSVAQAQPTTPTDFDQLQGDYGQCRAYSYTVRQGNKVLYCHQDVMCNVYCN